MNILFVTNTYRPHVGVGARSVETFSQCLREFGHRVMIIAPASMAAVKNEEGVLRIPTDQRFDGSDFAVRLPIPDELYKRIENFAPHIVHSQHPFLLGDTALRIAAHWDVPIVFTHHSMYEQYPSYVPSDSTDMKGFAASLATAYANQCQHVIAPSENIAEMIKHRGVDTPVTVVPTGIDLKRFQSGEGVRARRRYGIDDAAFVIGHVGRLAPEKNLPFLCRALVRFLKRHGEAVFLISGSGPSEAEIRRAFYAKRMEDRLVLTGNLTGRNLADVYHSMDLFVFASKSESQAVVVVEAMGSGIPAVALDAPGVREIMAVGNNGFLVEEENSRRFAAAIEQFYRSNPVTRRRLSRNAISAASAYDRCTCADRLLRTYKEVMETPRKSSERDIDLWEKSLRQLEAKWSSISLKASAMGLGRLIYRYSPLIMLEYLIRCGRRAFNRASWSAKLLKRPNTEDDPVSSGLVLLQIDGLSREQFERALRSGRLPFIKKLIKRGDVAFGSFFSGIPSTTSAVQGELFYGRQSVLPASCFRDPETRSVSGMLNSKAAGRAEQHLRKNADGLLDSGSCYCDVFHGGAAEPHFCSSASESKSIFSSDANRVAILIVAFMHGLIALRLGAGFIAEVLLAVFDFLRGLMRSERLLDVLKFIPSRLRICVFWRDLATAGVLIDISRGLPVIHANFIGYDEQAHHRGPDSSFALWMLKGIDRCIRKIWQATERADNRNYQVWIYSDHGQEQTVSYREIQEKSVSDALGLFFQSAERPEAPSGKNDLSVMERSAVSGGLMRRPRHRSLKKTNPASWERNGPAVALSGSLGHVYTQEKFSFDQKQALAARLPGEVGIPLVLIAGDDPDHCLAFTRESMLRLPEEGRRLFDATLPYFDGLLRDLVSLCHHPHAGDFIISGWRPEEAPVSFFLQHGAHGGPGSRETHGVVLLPADVMAEHAEKQFFRGNDLRSMALVRLNRIPAAMYASGLSPHPRDHRLRVMTYNVHGFRGMDNRVAPRRTVDVVKTCVPDVVCLQEAVIGATILSSEERKADLMHQFETAFGEISMHLIPVPQFGIAVASRYPLRLVKSAPLAGFPGRPNLEKRGALWVEIAVGAHVFQVVGTHLSLFEKERDIQVNELLGERWLSQPKCAQRAIFCGDLNMNAASFDYALISRRLDDVQCAVSGTASCKTWPSRFPLRMLDYIFVSRDLRVHSVKIPKNRLTMATSDHLPLVADIDLPPED